MVDKTYLLLAIFSCLVTTCLSQLIINKCEKGSQCKIINNCPPMLELVKSRRPKNLRIVRNSICGFEGRRAKVCCPTSEFFPKACGHTSASDRIFHGEEAPLGAYPWIASLGFSRPNKPDLLEFLCAGSIINERYILTAAHCFDPKDIGDRFLSVIRLGEWNLKTNPDCKSSIAGTFCTPPHLEVFPDDVIVHRDYDNRSRHSDDIALVRVHETIQFTAFIQPICLPAQDMDVFDIVNNRELLAMGWGYTENRSEIVDIMRRVKLPLRTHKECRDSHGSRYLDKQLCVGGVDNKDTCSGDSGGPLVISGPSGPPYLQLGIVSYGPIPCGIPNFPAVYTSVTSYRTWLAENMKPW